MKPEVLHKFEHESMESKVRWFQSLPLSERMEILCMYTDMILEINPEIAEKKDARSFTGRVLVLERAAINPTEGG